MEDNQQPDPKEASEFRAIKAEKQRLEIKPIKDADESAPTILIDRESNEMIYADPKDAEAEIARIVEAEHPYAVNQVPPIIAHTPEIISEIQKDKYEDRGQVQDDTSSLEIRPIGEVDTPHAEYWKDIPAYEVAQMHDMYAIIVDGPGYTHSMTHYPAETTILYSEWQRRKHDIMESNPLYKDYLTKLNSAGDEDTTVAKVVGTNPLVLTAYALEIQASFEETLHELENDPDYADQEELDFKSLRESLAEVKGTKSPHVVVGITHGDLTLSSVATAPVEGDGGDVMVVAMGKEIMAGKGLGADASAKEGYFVGMPKEGNKKQTEEMRRFATTTGTTEVPTTAPSTESSSNVLFDEIAPNHMEVYAEALREAGVNVKPLEETPFVTIDYEEIGEESDVENGPIFSKKLKEIADNLKRRISLQENDPNFKDDVLTNYSKNRASNKKTRTETGMALPSVKSMNLDELNDFAKKTSWDRDIDAGESIGMMEGEGKDGAFAFYTVDGIDDVKNRMDGVLNQIMKGAEPEVRKEITDKLGMHALRYIVYNISRETASGQWKFENMEIDTTNEVRLILNQNVQKKVSSDQLLRNNQEAVLSIYRSMEQLKNADFYYGLSEFMARMTVHEFQKIQDERRSIGQYIDNPKDQLAAVEDMIKETLTEKPLFKANVGVTAGNKDRDDSTRYYIYDESKKKPMYTWRKKIGGDATSTTARYAGIFGHDRFKTYRAKAEKKLQAPKDDSEKEQYEGLVDTWTNIQELRDLGEITDNTITMDRWLADEIGVQGDNVVTADGIVLKGRPPTNIAVISV